MPLPKPDVRLSPHPAFQFLGKVWLVCDLLRFADCELCGGNWRIVQSFFRGDVPCPVCVCGRDVSQFCPGFHRGRIVLHPYDVFRRVFPSNFHHSGCLFHPIFFSPDGGQDGRAGVLPLMGQGTDWGGVQTACIQWLSWRCDRGFLHLPPK